MTSTYKEKKRPGWLGKRGSITDVLVILVVIGFVTAISFIVSFKFYNEFYAVAAPMLNSSNESVTALDSMKGTETTFDTMFMVIIIGLIIVGYILAFMTRENPIFIFIDILLILVMVVIGGAMSYAYNAVENDPQLLSTAASFPMTHFFYSNLPLIMAAAIFGMIIVMFTLGGSADGY
jgi:magnesium-transporting ATPase (P-type)